MAKLRRNEYWAWINKNGDFVLDFDGSPVIRKLRSDVAFIVRDVHTVEEMQQIIHNGQGKYKLAFPAITKIKLTYQII